MCVHVQERVTVGVCVQRAGQYRGGGYPVTASGKQYYSTGMSHMQCYSASHTQTHTHTHEHTHTNGVCMRL